MTTITATESEPLVDAGWLAEHVDDPGVRLVEVDVTSSSYDQGHIPGAVLWNAYVDLRRPDYTPVGTVELEGFLGRCGVAPETTLAFYGYAAHLGYWLARAHGHKRAVVMDGPREEWTGPWSIVPPTHEPASHNLPPATGLATKDQVLGLDGLLLDVRADAEHAGEIFWPSGAPEERGRPGHVPGAVHLPISELRTETAFRPIDEMKAALSRHGLTPDRPVTTYCTIGNRASQAWYALTHLLGFEDVAVYFGGWAEWGSDPELPVERRG